MKYVAGTLTFVDTNQPQRHVKELELTSLPNRLNMLVTYLAVRLSSDSIRCHIVPMHIQSATVAAIRRMIAVQVLRPRPLASIHSVSLVHPIELMVFHRES